MPIFAQVAILSPPYSTLTYSLPAYLPEDVWRRGLRVAVPLGKSLRAGVLMEIGELTVEVMARGDEGQLPVIKPIAWPLETEPLLSGKYMEFISELGKRQTVSPGRIIANLLPAGLRSAKTRIRFFGTGKPLDLDVRSLVNLEHEEILSFARLWIEGKIQVNKAGQSPLDAELCIPACDPPWPIRPAAKLQTAVMEYLFENGPATRRRLKEKLGDKTLPVLSSLVSRGLITISPVDEFGLSDLSEQQAINEVPILPGAALSLTDKQREVFESLDESLRSGKTGTSLLFGITGSGKTAIYMELARKTLQAGRSVMLLAPEVALALKLWNDSTATLPKAERRLFHGYLSPAAKEKIFRETAVTSVPTLVIGTRSALFLPLENLGLIILDEEHDSSFKQDEGFIYQAKEVAWFRAGQENALLLLGSATPDIKSFHAAVQKKFPMYRLSERVGKAVLPEVKLVPMPKARNTDQLLAPESIEALNHTVERGEQAVILLNRRGYAPLMYCLGCGTVAKCPHCDIGLSYHKGRERLLCHYCGYSVPFPSPCSNCNGLHYLPMGDGTEKLEENLSSILPPGCGILRLDRDNTRRPGRMEEILSAFARKEASVLVGTQMLSKGHHFPDVTLAIVAEADLGLNLPDYRAAERTFQLLLQSSGRSGRGDKKGTVLIQTRDPGHYCWEYVLKADYEGFFARELELRQRRMYPPFVFLALLRISYPMELDEGSSQVAALGQALRSRAKEYGVTLLGPAPAPLPFLKGRRRFHCLLKGKDWRAIRTLYNVALEQIGKTKLRISLDLDPVNML